MILQCLGEGEPAFRQILKQRLMNRNYNGIPSVFPKGGDICNLPTRFKDLETIPSPILNGFYDMIIDKVEAKAWQTNVASNLRNSYEVVLISVHFAI